MAGHPRRELPEPSSSRIHEGICSTLKCDLRLPCSRLRLFAIQVETFGLTSRGSGLLCVQFVTVEALCKTCFPS